MAISRLSTALVVAGAPNGRKVILASFDVADHTTVQQYIRLDRGSPVDLNGGMQPA